MKLESFDKGSEGFTEGLKVFFLYVLDIGYGILDIWLYLLFVNSLFYLFFIWLYCLYVLFFVVLSPGLAAS